MEAWTTPFDRAPRPDTGLTNGQLGLGLGMAAQLMLFGALVASYVLLEVGAAPGAWPAVGQRGAHPLMPGAQGALALSLVFAVIAWRRAARGAFRPWIAGVGVMGLAALALTALDWSGKLAAGQTPAAHTFFACYFVLSGVVSLQLVAGLVVCGGLLARTGGAANVTPLATERARLVSGWWIFNALCGSVAYAVLYHL